MVIIIVIIISNIKDSSINFMGININFSSYSDQEDNYNFIVIITQNIINSVKNFEEDIADQVYNFGFNITGFINNFIMDIAKDFYQGMDFSCTTFFFNNLLCY